MAPSKNSPRPPKRNRAFAPGARSVLFGVMLALAVPAPAEAEPTEHVVVMDNMDYGKMPANVKVGDSTVWVNRDTVPHTATARGGAFDVRVPQGKKVRMTEKKAGTYAIYCIMHPAMRTSLKVAGAS